MKKILLILVAFVAVFLLISCVHVEPQDMLPDCQDQYAILLAEDPDFPHAYIGACVAYLQSQKPTAFVSLCGYEPFRELIEESEGIVLDTKKDCMQYIRNLEE